jgi:anti-sigma B factor antagonist
MISLMALTLKSRTTDNVVILDMSGSLTVGEAVAQLRQAIQSHTNNGERKFVLNLADVSYIDSSGLGELVWAYTSVRNKGGDVKLLNLTAKAKDLMQMTKLLTVFDTYDSESRAVGALIGWPSNQ